MNSLTIIGNLTKAPELRTTATGLSVCSFTVAVNRRKSGSEQPEVDFFNVTAWRQLGELCAKFLDKGRKVCVIGPVTIRTWDKGEKHGASMEVSAENVEFLSPRVSDAAEAPAAPVSPAKEGGFTRVETDELPF